MAASAALGIGLAFLVERTDLPARRLWHGLLVAPLAVPAFVNGYAWVSLDRSIHGFGGARLVVTLSYYPLVYLPAVAALRGLDPALEEASWSLGHTRWQTFARVVLPQLRPALLGGSLLVGLHLLVGVRRARAAAVPHLHHRDLRPVRLHLQRRGRDRDGRRAGAAVPVPAARRAAAAGHRRYARVGHGAARVAEPLRPAPPALAAAGAGRGAGRARARRADVRPRPLAGRRLLHRVPARRAAAGDRLDRRARRPRRGWSPRSPRSRSRGWPCATAAAVTTARRAQHVRRQRAARHRRGAWPSWSPACGWCRRSTRPRLLLVVAYAILFLPRAVVSVRAAPRAGAGRCSTTSRRASAAGPLATARRVTLPLIAPGLGAGAALVFLAVATELTATLMLAPIGTRTLATEFWSRVVGAALRRRRAVRPAAGPDLGARRRSC